jgi:EAL domain-containing protein (putative c-di-GMP-specific phosphodiesterase class I)/ActR/RegA family two-component response regulator
MNRVFIIDDDEQVALMLAEVVTLSSFEAITYTDSRQFIEEAKFDNDCLILLDLNMPQMDGVEVIRELAAHNCRAKLILMSGYDESVLHSAEKLAQAHELEIVQSVNKPIKLNELLKLLIDCSKQNQNLTSFAYKSDFTPTIFDLAEAISNDQLVVYFQPQIDFSTSELIGAEALVRWQHPEHGLIPPDAFIELAEQGQQMANLTTKVIDKGLEVASLFVGKGKPFNLSVNVSASMISSLELPEQLEECLKNYNVPARYLTIEITESALMGKLVTSLDILTRIRMKGINLSIDDFGTGFSSLSQLHKVPFNELKVDKSFVMHMDTDHEARAIVKTCIMLGHELKMTVVAEGIESKKALDLLGDLACDTAQGYFISKPKPEHEFIEWVQNFAGF